MATWLQENTVLTNVGLSMLSKAQVGLGKLCITKIVTRDVWDEVENNRNLTGDSTQISNIKQSAVLLKPPGEGDAETPEGENIGVSKIVARFSNENLTERYHIKQVVVFTKLIDIDPDAPEGTDMGEVPYMVAQTENSEDVDIMPLFSENPTAINYDLYIVHAGVASIDIAVKTAGYVDEDTFNEFKEYVINIFNNGVGQNTQGMTFNVWSPQYTEDDDPSGGRQWSKSTDTVEMSGTKSAERFNYYGDSEGNMAIGANCHVEGFNNVATSTTNHIEGDSNHAGLETYGTHIEGRRNSAKIGWFQHIEGERNQSSGYANHIEGVSNKVLNNDTNNVGKLHIEGEWNTVKNGVRHHVEGIENVVVQGQNHHVEGSNNKVEQGSTHHVEGYSNSVTGSGDCSHVSGQLNKVHNCGEVNVSGRENTVSDSNQASVSGLYNTVVNSQRAIVSGTNNTVTNSRGTNVSGDSNSAVGDCFESTVSGYSNQTSSSAHTFVSGFNNIVSDSDNSIVSGYSNQTSVNVCESVISGNSNKVKNNIREYAGNMFVSGYQNTVIDSSESIISGLTNSVTYVVDSIVSGSSNSILFDSTVPTKFVNNSFISGFKNNVERTERTIITGNANNVTDYKPNGVAGERMMSANTVISGEGNKLNGIFSSVVTGFRNNVTNVHDSFIGGRENVITSNVEDGATNCITCTGYSCTVTSSGHPIFATGSYNYISGNNSSVFGSNNIASGFDQVVMGHYNVEDTENRFAFVVGGGSKNGENVSRKNILELDWEGNLHISALYISDIYNEDGSGQMNSWNIADGTGQGSLVGNNIAANHATSLYSTAFGNQTEATANYAFATGSTSKARGQSSVSMGDTCESTADYSFTTGLGCKAKSGASQSVGYFNSIDTNSYSAFVSGYQNVVESSFASLTSGQENTNNGSTSFVIGKQNTNSGENSIVGGQSNSVLLSNNSLVTGTNNSVSQSNCSIVAGTKVTLNNASYCVSISDSYSHIKSATNCVIIGTNRITGESINGSVGHLLLVGTNNQSRGSDSILVGQDNKSAGGRNLLVGFQNDAGYSLDTGDVTSINGISCLLSGTGNDCLGVDNILCGNKLYDYSFDDHTTRPTKSNPPNYVADNAAFFGEYNDNSDTLIQRNVFTIGNGSGVTSRSNAFSVSKTGEVYAQGTYHTGNADIAEWFEWEDSNTLKEDRRGLFVTLNGDKITLADENTKYIFGIVSASPALVGNSYEDFWNDKYLKDVFGETIYEDYVVPAETKTVINEDGEEETVVITEEHFEKRPVLNPDYDPNKKYIPRSQRPEWSYVSCKGRLVMVDDGTCVVNGYCKPKSGGIATAADFDTTYRVMKRIDDTHILVWSNGAVTID